MTNSQSQTMEYNGRDLSLILADPRWSDLDNYVKAAVDTGHFVTCVKCRRIIGVGKDDESAQTDALSSGRKVRDGKWYCNRDAGSR